MIKRAESLFPLHRLFLWLFMTYIFSFYRIIHSWLLTKLGLHRKLTGSSGLDGQISSNTCLVKTTSCWTNMFWLMVFISLFMCAPVVMLFLATQAASRYFTLRPTCFHFLCFYKKDNTKTYRNNL